MNLTAAGGSIELASAKASKPRLKNRKRINLEIKYLLTRQLTALQKAGVPLLSSLRALEEQMPSGDIKLLLKELRADLLAGRTFSQALSKHPHAFDPIYVGMVRVGEAAGILEDVLRNLTMFFEWEIELRAKLKQALQYPIIVLIILSVALVIILNFVLPQFARMFKSFQIQLPFQTRLLIWLSEFFSHYGLAIILALILGAFLWFMYVRTDKGRLFWHTHKLRLPILGSLILQLTMSRVARTIAALNASGVPMLETLALAAGSVNNSYIKARLDEVREQVKAGEPLSSAFRRHRVFPPIVVQMVATGEETGHTDDLLNSVSEYYDQQADHSLRKLIAYLEPALLIVVGLGVLVMATAVFVPMWDLVQVFKTGR